MRMSKAMKRYHLIVGPSSYKPLRWGATANDWRTLYYLRRDGMDGGDGFFTATGRTPEEAVAKAARRIEADVVKARGILARPEAGG